MWPGNHAGPAVSEGSGRVLITCGVSQCTSGDDSAALANSVYTKLKNFMPIGLGGATP